MHMPTYTSSKMCLQMYYIHLLGGNLTMDMHYDEGMISFKVSSWSGPASLLLKAVASHCISLPYLKESSGLPA